MLQNKNLLKAQGFWITFIAYAIIHALRMCYSFNKVNLKRQFEISQFHLGLLDTLLYLSYGVGVFIRYEIFQGNESMKKVFFITSMLISCCFGAIGYYGLFLESSIIGVKVGKILVTLGVIGYGFFHLAVYQICGAIVSGYYHPSKQSHKLGFWGSSSSAGNVLGFLVSNLIIYELKLKWQVSVLLFAIINLLMTFLFYFWVEMPQQDETYKLKLYELTQKGPQKRKSIKNQQITSKQEQKGQIATIHWLAFIKKTISTSEQAKFTYLAYIIIKAAVYTFLMWFPIFLVSKHLQSVSGYISTLFDIGGTVGGYLIGKLHKMHYHSEEDNSSNFQTNNDQNYNNNFTESFLKYRNVFFIVCITLLILSFIFVQGSLVSYCPLTFLMGFFLGGIFNNISSHEIFKIAKGKVLLTDMLLNLSVGISTIMVGLVQLLTAFLLKWDVKTKAKEEQVNYGVVFVVLLVLMVLCVMIMIKRVFVIEKNKKLNLTKIQT